MEFNCLYTLTHATSIRSAIPYIRIPQTYPSKSLNALGINALRTHIKFYIFQPMRPCVSRTWWCVAQDAWRFTYMDAERVSPPASIIQTTNPRMINSSGRGSIEWVSIEPVDNVSFWVGSPPHIDWRIVGSVCPLRSYQSRWHFELFSKRELTHRN